MAVPAIPIHNEEIEPCFGGNISFMLQKQSFIDLT